MNAAYRILVPLLFFCSGGAALVYEVIWSKYLALIFGSTAQAQTTVLAVFMAGLALGNNFFGRIAHRQQSPLERYGFMEVGLGLWAFFFPQLYSAGDSLFVSVGAPFLGSTATLLAIKGVVALLLLFVPTFLMGGTLPMIAVWLGRRTGDAPRLIARFYAINTIGAVTGAALAGFYLVQNLGLPDTLRVIGFANVLLGLVAIGAARRELPVEVKAALEQSTNRAKVDWRLCALVATTGAISLALEGLAARALALLVGGSLYAFAIVLIAFILGIGIGGSVVASPRLKLTWRAVWWMLICASVYIALFVQGLERWTIFYSQAKLGLAPNETGYLYHQWLVVILAIIALGIPAALLGSVLPLCLRTQLAPGADPGAHVGRLLTWNALGAVVGALAAGFLMMPLFGLRGSLGVCSGLLVVAALLYAAANNATRLRTASIMVGIVVVGSAAFGAPGWRHVLGSGVFRLRGSAITPAILEDRKQNVRILYYEDAADATVAVESSKNPNWPEQLVLKVNGKADASSAADLSTQMLLGHLPMMVRPEGTDVFVLGLGSGITGGAILAHQNVTNLTIAENCRPIIEAAELFAPWNENVLKSPRTRLFFEDARTVLKLSRQKYDVIISEPSNPWTAGIGSVFSREFYELAASRLKEGGVVAQWFHIYEMNDGIVNLVLRTFSSVFPVFEIWEPQAGDLILIGGQSKWQIDLEKVRLLYGNEAIQRKMNDIGLATPESVFARQLASQRTAWAIPGDGGMQQDHFPVLEYAAPRAFFIGRSATEIFDFDERTQQMLLAPPMKAAALRGLEPKIAWQTFAEYPSDNHALMEALRTRATQQEGGPITRATLFHDLAQAQFVAASSTNVLEARLVALEGRILAAPSPELAREMSGLIDEATKADKPHEQAQLGRYAAVAAKVFILSGQPEEARKVIELGRLLSPAYNEFAFLERIVDVQAPR